MPENIPPHPALGFLGEGAAKMMWRVTVASSNSDDQGVRCGVEWPKILLQMYHWTAMGQLRVRGYRDTAMHQASTLAHRNIISPDSQCLPVRKALPSPYHYMLVYHTSASLQTIKASSVLHPAPRASFLFTGTENNAPDVRTPAVLAPGTGRSLP